VTGYGNPARAFGQPNGSGGDTTLLSYTDSDWLPLPPTITSDAFDAAATEHAGGHEVTTATATAMHV